MNISPSSPAASTPRPIPAGIGIEIDGPDRPDAPEELNGREVATFSYTGSKGGGPLVYHATIGDPAHTGHLVEGTFEEAVAVARFESAVDDIDMPLLGASAVIESAQKGAWYVVPLIGSLDGKGETYSYLPIDAGRGAAKGPGGIYDAIGGYSRPDRDIPDGIQGAMHVRVKATDPAVKAIVGVERWVDLRS